LLGLQRHGLIHSFAYGRPSLLQRWATNSEEQLQMKEDGLIVDSSAFGAELFMYVHGKSDYQSENDFFSSEFEVKSTADINIPGGSIKLTFKRRVEADPEYMNGSY
jgi:hypothetical protein